MRELENRILAPGQGSKMFLARGDIVLYKEPLRHGGYNILLSRKVRKGAR